jgi:hypothetical protein
MRYAQHPLCAGSLNHIFLAVRILPEEVLKKLVIMVRNADMRPDKTTCGIIDAQSVQNADTAGKKGMMRAKRCQESGAILLRTRWVCPMRC